MPTAATNTRTAKDPDTSDDAPVIPLGTHLFLVLEAERPRAGGARYSLAETNEVVIGRGPDRTVRRDRSGSGTRLRISLPSSRVSSLHARLRNHRGHWTIEDLGSTNGTFVNGIRVTEAVLNDRDSLEIGQVTLIFRDALGTPGGPARELELGPSTDGLQVRSLLPLEEERMRVLSAMARTPLPVLLLGESGTGKEVLARAVHAQSGRLGSLVGFNCGGLSSGLFESQLFGHTRGAFSGATRDELGLVRAAEGGTLFLDEIGDMPPAAQVALLRVLQEGEVLPLGTARPCRVDVRVIAATHRPLHQLSASGTFRADLLARLHGHLHTLPALRHRREDLGVLLADLLTELDPAQRIRRLSADAARSLLAHSWPLNVRQLRHALTRAAVLVEDGVLRRRDLDPEPFVLDSEPEASGAAPRPALSASDEELRKRLLALLSAERGNVAEVARALGKARMQVQRWMKRFGIDPANYRDSSRGDP
ncbi:MAG TPA: sigma 54-interacting transcriptional regulator [Polyangiaceae bacterium]|nr:sigma 54-interacting transcriptional regulator [Polyangiaceae bacterium]